VKLSVETGIAAMNFDFLSKWRHCKIEAFENGRYSFKMELCLMNFYHFESMNSYSYPLNDSFPAQSPFE
jgi:hypothetical protein